MRLYLATANAHKVEEFSRLFAEAGLEVQVRSATEVGGMPPVDEMEPDFVGNARLKAQALGERVGPDDWVLADDSGLEVAVLGGEPGVRSARYAGPDATDAENRAKLLERLNGVEPADRQGQFVCVLVLQGPKKQENIFAGVCRGRIVSGEKGHHGFGYDPVFVPEGLEQTFAEVGPSVKDRLSHRGRALGELVKWLREANFRP